MTSEIKNTNSTNEITKIEFEEGNLDYTCPHCGNTVHPKNAKYCGICGSKIETAV